MMRTRLLWFTLGLSTTGVSISYLVLRGLSVDRQCLSSDLTQTFEALENRVSNLERALPKSSDSILGEGDLH